MSKIIKIKRPGYEEVIFQKENDTWVLNIDNIEKSTQILTFCIDLLIKAKVRNEDQLNNIFADHELALLMRYFTNQRFVIERGDTLLDENLEKALSLLGEEQSPDLIESLQYMSYNDKLTLADRLATIMGNLAK